MPFLGTDDLLDRDDASVEILAEVKLIFFKSAPGTIGPFGASVLSWKVEGPPGFQVELNLLNVPKAGEKVVQPASSTTFRLSARAGRASRTLGYATVDVDSTGCEVNGPIVNPRSTLQAALRSGVQANPDVYFRSEPPAVSFAPGRISFGLRLQKRVNNFPDPDVDIDASFGLAVSDGALVAVGAQVTVDVSVPFWAWAIPGALPGLAIAIDMGKDSARKAGHEAVEGLVQLINFLATAPQGKRLRTVRIDDGNNGAGIIEVTACPDDLLRQFAAISESVLTR
jgi:hypothetical protein